MTSFARGALFGVAGAAAVAATLAVVTPVHFTGATAEAKNKELWHEPAGNDQPAVQGLVPLPSLAPLVKKVKPAVVFISTSNVLRYRKDASDEFFRRFFMGPDGAAAPDDQAGTDRITPRGLGSGFIIHEKGLVLTNNHVIDGADLIEVNLSDGRSFKADVVGRDARTDVALLQMREAHDLPAVTLGDSDRLEVGDWVVAIGNPFGFAYSTSAGIVSAKERSIGAGPYDDFIQTDAAINPGNSGGPLFDTRGEVIGINTAIAAHGQGIGFAVPINMAKVLIPQLEANGRVIRGWLGVALQELTPELASTLHLEQTHGALVREVVPGSPAEVAGLHSGDVVVTVDGKPVDGDKSLARTVALNAPGTKLALDVLRDGKSRQVQVTISERDEDLGKVIPAKGQRSARGDVLGLQVGPPPRQMARQLGPNGVLVTEVVAGSPAARAGVAPGDVILELNRQPVASVGDYAGILRSVHKGEMALLRILRGDGAVYIAVRGELS